MSNFQTNKLTPKQSAARSIATMFGLGYTPKIPGTVGSLPGLAIGWLAHHNVYVSAATGFLLIVLGLWSIKHTELATGTHDDRSIVIDEVAGQYLTVIWFPFDIWTFVIGFALFRLLDIWKPGPIGWIDQHLPGAAGTFFDDILAGLCAAVILWLIRDYGVLLF